MAFKANTISASGEFSAGCDIARDDAVRRESVTAQTASLDETLQRWLATTNETQAAAWLSELLAVADPLIGEIVSFQLRFSTRDARHTEGEDICAEARLRLLTKLTALRADPHAQPIHNLRSYIAVTAYRACYESLRRRHPQRYGLKHKVRVVLREHSAFTAWESPEGWLCGLSAWPPVNPVSHDAVACLAQLRAHPPLIALNHRDNDLGKDLPSLLRAILQQAGQPLALESIVSLIAEWWEIKDHPLETLNNDDANEHALFDPRPNAASAFDQRAYLSALWLEVLELTQPQRSALLLNLREGQGGNAAELWLFTGIVKFGQLADALALSEAELAELWNGMPLDDFTIANRLGIARQQVINLRKVARAKLARGLRARGF